MAEYVFDRPGTDDYFGSGWNGMLVIQDLDEQTASLDRQGENEVKILQASELEGKLERVLREILA